VLLLASSQPTDSISVYSTRATVHNHVNARLYNSLFVCQCK